MHHSQVGIQTCFPTTLSVSLKPPFALISHSSDTAILYYLLNDGKDKAVDVGQRGIAEDPHFVVALLERDARSEIRERDALAVYGKPNLFLALSDDTQREVVHSALRAPDALPYKRPALSADLRRDDSTRCAGRLLVVGRTRCDRVLEFLDS